MKHDLENSVGELTRLAELGQVFARHGLKNLGSLLGFMPVSENEPDTEDLRPASVVALLRARRMAEDRKNSFIMQICW